MAARPETEQLLDDLRNVVADTEALLAATAGEAGSRADEARQRVAESLEQARIRLQELEYELKTRARAAAHETDRYVRENPWQSVGIAAAAGLVIGLLLSRR
ncbi:MAG: YqjD family protein [Pseudomonadota bacterium]|jgi:ElaB/YqjD/DUF883 family membrane-anchored ribosome-binding protein